MAASSNPWGVAAKPSSVKPKGFFSLESDGAKSPSRSFKEVVSGNPSEGDIVSSLTHSTVNGVPAVLLSDDAVLKLASPFQFTLLGKFSMRRPNLDAIRLFFNNLKLSDFFSIGLLDSRHVAIQLSNDLDYSRVFARHAYYINRCQMRLLKWTPFFDIKEESSIVPIWISFPNLRLHFFNPSVLHALGSIFGRLLQTDQATATRTRPSVARVLVEVDITKKHAKEVWLGSKAFGNMQKVEFEKVPDFCSNCKVHGHHLSECFNLHPNLRHKPVSTNIIENPVLCDQLPLVNDGPAGNDVEPSSNTGDETKGVASEPILVNDGADSVEELPNVVDNMQELGGNIEGLPSNPQLYISVDDMLKEPLNPNTSPPTDTLIKDMPGENIENGEKHNMEIEEGEFVAKSNLERNERTQNDARNEANHNGKKMEAASIIIKVKDKILELFAANLLNAGTFKHFKFIAQRLGLNILVSFILKRNIIVNWCQPNAPFYKLNSDGSVKNNRASGGGIIRTKDGSVLAAFATTIHTNCVLTAELLALFAGIKLCVSHGLLNVWIEVDAMHVISMINSDHVNPKNFYLIRNIKNLLSQLNFWISHIFREANGDADFLANMGCQIDNDMIFSGVNLPHRLKGFPIFFCSGYGVVVSSSGVGLSGEFIRLLMLIFWFGGRNCFLFEELWSWLGLDCPWLAGMGVLIFWRFVDASGGSLSGISWVGDRGFAGVLDLLGSFFNICFCCGSPFSGHTRLYLGISVIFGLAGDLGPLVLSLPSSVSPTVQLFCPPTSIVGAMAELAVGPIMKKIIDTCFGFLDNDYLKDYFKDYLKDQFRWQTGMKEELERLRENHPKIQAVVFAANQAQISDQNPALNKWIWQLRDAIDEANDVLDDFEYMKHEEQLTKNKEETKKRKFTSFLFESGRKILKIGERVFKRDPNLKRLGEAVQKLDKVSADVTPFLRLLDRAKQEQKEHDVDFYKYREAGFLPKNVLIGRGKDKEYVVQWLRKPSNEHRGTDFYRNISLLSIKGHSGMGKTTLLQHVYEDEITKEFDLKMWVCVSNNFDAKKVISDMLECHKKERPRLETLGALQGALKEEVMSKKLLLVLDDIWEEDEEKNKSKWEDVLAPIASGGFGSKILVTTRMNSVALMFAKVIQKKEEIVKLEGLEEDECLRLLNSHAFAGVENPSDDHEKLRVIAAEIVKKLLGSPLAAKVIGGVLNDNLDEMHWSTVLESNLLGQSSIHSILRLSYIVLPNLLQNCLAFCCMFPQDHTFDKDDLVRMWIALGFIQLSQEMTMEDIGRRYFDVLVKKALFDKVEDDYKMHDLIHESASKFFAQECGKLVDDEESSLKNFETIRHLFVRTTNQNIFKKIEKFKHLHSLFLFYEGSNQDHCSALIKIFEASRCLRLLYIHIDKLEMIPEEIRYLKHLRYLTIERTDVTRLPRSLSNLYHLQYLIYDGWKQGQPEFLPSDINNLSNLRHIKLPKKYISSIRGIGKLNSLQELHMFDLRNEMGYRIDEFKYLNDLCKLRINFLENVKDAEEARDAQLCEKKRLTDLTLSWGSTDSRNIDLDENVLDNLQPPKCLRNLCIEKYMGARSAIWMNNINLLSNIKKIELSNCWEWETLPPFGQLPFLKILKLDDMPKVKCLVSKFNGNDQYHAFPLLEFLHFSGLEALEDWFEAGVAAEDGCLFPCLIELKLYNCPKLKELPSLPPKLKTLRINEIGWTTLNFCSNSNPIPLERLEVLGCQNITSLPLADEIARLAALRFLKIEHCPNLISLGEMQTTNNCHLILSLLSISDPSVLLMEPLRSIASLKILRISENDEVVSFPNEAEQWFRNVRSSLSKLHFARLKSLESLPSSLESLSSLQGLIIYDVPMLRELPNLPPSLESLNIWGKSHPELKRRYLEKGGSDRHKIAHIPHIDI
ncbi:hypothetical protein M5K25_000229 [Dendrobium thyrsiflorum]|uniref:RNase H type-1 domain-containing protein n=1 Tax=Dendrobium thyrsiflorum TaxID=117978 RepID=A0ABD0VT30_DENTH